MTVDLTGGDRAAILSFASGARYRIGWETRGFAGKRHMYTHRSRPGAGMHMVLQNLEVTRPFGISTENVSVDFQIPVADKKFVDALLKEVPEQSGPVVHIHPTSRWLFKCWNNESMSRVIKWLLGSGARIVVTASPEKAEMLRAEAILSPVGSHPGLLNLCGRTTIKELGAISQRADLFFGVDSAPMHIAAAVGTPVVALFGPTDPRNWGPWPNDLTPGLAPYTGRGTRSAGMHTVIQQNRDCISCGRDGCDGSKLSHCLEELDTHEVKNVLKTAMRNVPGQRRVPSC
jgi:heptosyltransferase-3